MNRLGMVVDLSHVSTDTMNDALDIAEAPVMFSHSSALALTPSPRNVPDSVLARLRKNGGVVMVDFISEFAVMARARALESRLRGGPANQARRRAYDAALEKYTQNHPEPKATLQDVAAHIEHVRKVAESITSASAPIFSASRPGWRPGSRYVALSVAVRGAGPPRLDRRDPRQAGARQPAARAAWDGAGRGPTAEGRDRLVPDDRAARPRARAAGQVLTARPAANASWTYRNSLRPAPAAWPERRSASRGRRGAPLPAVAAGVFRGELSAAGSPPVHQPVAPAFRTPKARRVQAGSVTR